ncbi:CU044_5270 family protein [Actinomadura hibisca]|uniref:CU044_5270 family protein n=1 Tax=Actinomadura hibisca TaxID=68565 RepID=UPI00082CF1CD|nr:CU044_5270 family protein [Actinomadura hibisca]
MDEIQQLGALLAKPEPDGDVTDARRHQLQRAMRGQAPAQRRRRGLLAGGLGLAGTAAVAATAIVLASGGTAPTVTPNSPPVAQPQSARQVLLAAAGTAERATEGTGRYWYVRTVTTEREGGRTVGESWTRRDGTAWVRNVKSEGKVFRLPVKRSVSLVHEGTGFEEIRTLPTEPGRLTERIRALIKGSDLRTSAGRPDAAARDQFLRTSLVALVSQLPATPKVRGAALRALAALPQVTALGPVRGGEGLLIVLAEGQQARLVVDPGTGRVRDSNFMVAHDGGEYWTEGTFTVYAEWTDHLPK